jgi:hypothetical protein
MTKEEKAVYNRKWYLEHRVEDIQNSIAYARSNREKIRAISAGLAVRNRTFINKQKSSPCMDCKGTFPPCAMEFDHRDRATKSGAVANFASSHSSIKKIQAEIDKCDLVCSNCHRIRTYNKKQFLPIAKVAA